MNPTLAELGVTAPDLGRVYDFGEGLDVPAGTPTSFFAPDIDAFREAIGFDCNCVNEYGDWPAVVSVEPGQPVRASTNTTPATSCRSTSTTISFGHRLFGNVGQRNAETTRSKSTGFTTNVAATGPRPLLETNEYTDDLPSINIAYRAHADDLLMRGALGEGDGAAAAGQSLADHHGHHDAERRASAAPGSMTIGNPQLTPFRAENIDLSVEWYFTEGGLLSLALFKKDVSNFPQTVSTADTLQEILHARAVCRPRSRRRRQSQQRLDYGRQRLRAGSLRACASSRTHPAARSRVTRSATSRTSPSCRASSRTSACRPTTRSCDSELPYIVDPG